MPAPKKTSKRPRRRATIKEPEARMEPEAPAQPDVQQEQVAAPTRMACVMCNHTVTVPAGGGAPAHCRRCGSTHGWDVIGTEVRG